MTIMFPGTVLEDKVEVPISKLKHLVNEGEIGFIKLEVIADDVKLEVDYSKKKPKVFVEIVGR